MIFAYFPMVLSSFLKQIQAGPVNLSCILNLLIKICQLLVGGCSYFKYPNSRFPCDWIEQSTPTAPEITKCEQEKKRLQVPQEPGRGKGKRELFGKDKSLVISSPHTPVLCNSWRNFHHFSLSQFYFNVKTI